MAEDLAGARRKMVMAWRGRKGLKRWGWWWEGLGARGRGGNVGISLTRPKCGRRRPNTQWVMKSWGRKQSVLLGTSGCLSSRHTPVWVKSHTQSKWRTAELPLSGCTSVHVCGTDLTGRTPGHLSRPSSRWRRLSDTPQLHILTPTKGSYLTSWVTPIFMSEEDCSPYC